MLVFEERWKPEYPEKNLSEQGREPTNSTHIWRRRRDLNPGNIDEWRVLLPLGGPPLLPTATDKCWNPTCSPKLIDENYWLQ